MALKRLLTQFLVLLSTAFGKWLPGNWLKKPPQAIGPQHLFVVPGGEVARFTFNERDLYSSHSERPGCPKPSAFKPDFFTDLSRFEVSVCGLAGVPLQRVWHLGKTIRAKEGKSAVAAILLTDSKIQNAGLRLEAAPVAPAYLEHGVVLGWSPLPDAKSERLQMQLDLALQCTAQNVCRPTP